MKIPDTQKAISENIARLWHKGYRNPQAIAISYSEAGEGKLGGSDGRGGHRGGAHRGGHHGHTGKGHKKG